MPDIAALILSAQGQWDATQGSKWEVTYLICFSKLTVELVSRSNLRGASLGVRETNPETRWGWRAEHTAGACLEGGIGRTWR